MTGDFVFLVFSHKHHICHSEYEASKKEIRVIKAQGDLPKDGTFVFIRVEGLVELGAGKSHTEQ